ncbi:hypothetical protein SAMD00019534_081950 [Acytostelium subglobosum LB1]|uniref:hypothetical protein n=1 Tax=Acytostelium subglobosum LB1 TaxID=1410327 RepID=UPI000644E100|nr:hypothetical protein SAMD00019534_081950 [Acytostelium subglobosum LB1]GAM25020.1 hypothetical protein SAMD00019534_081950 [Acytostelium subglobosum LB1]|eukprot:XP_012752109.1 hypothetical protein SAMD00019534_081950 [Acytostelium subglobosum LB1]
MNQSSDLNNFFQNGSVDENGIDDSLNNATDSVINQQQQQQQQQQRSTPTKQQQGGSNGAQYHVPIVNPVTTNQPLLGPETGLQEYQRSDLTAIKEKQLGILRFEVITNDSSVRNLELLMNLKNVFSKQLPKMPREYIVRLIFDRFHHSLLIIKRDVVIGGISFRPFREQGFIEIAFCAITSNEQVKGYGSYLMTHLKEHNRKTGIYHFLTFADNFAIEYFQKQGFTHEITLARDKWKGFIQEYDGGSLMECVVHPNVPYLDISSLVREQREVLNKKIRTISTSHVVHPGLKHFQQGRRLAIGDIPGIKQAGWVQTQTEQQIQALHKELQRILDEVKSHPESWPFLTPVTDEIAPNYSNVIKDPVDLSKVAERLATGCYYITKYMFLADLKRMCENCRLYNTEGAYFHIANRLEQYVIQQCQALP